MKIKSILSLLFLAVLLAGFSSCGSDELTDKDYFADLVTYTSSGDGSTFTLIEKDNADPVVLTTTRKLGSEFHTGERVYIVYAPESGERLKSGPVDLLSVSKVYGEGDAPEDGTAASTDNWASDPITLGNMYLSSTYLNILFSGSIGNGEPLIHLYADVATLDNDYPELHFTYGPRKDFATRDVVYICSYNLETIFDRSTCKGVKIYMNAPANECTTFQNPRQSIKPAN